MNIYIANLHSAISNEQLRDLFTPFGEVKSAEIAIDVFTNQSRGFGYVEMEKDEEAKKAIENLQNTSVQDLLITVEEAPAKKEHKGSYKAAHSGIPVYRFKKY